MPDRRTAEYKCLGCSHAWVVPFDPRAMGRGECPACGHIYFAWLNYERDFARH